jgi:uncharacterized coiled-coil protein SlyX
MTMHISAAAAVALDAPSLPNQGIYSYSATVEFLMKSNAKQAPAILSLLFAKLILDEPTMLFSAADRQRINQAEMPTDKAAFDEIFSTTSASGRLTCRFEIKSERRTFHPIKMGVWEILQKYGIFLKKSAAPVKKTTLSMMGFWVNVHPRFASAHVFHAEICDSIKLDYNTDPNLLDALGLDHDYSPPAIYLDRRKVSSSFHSADGTTSDLDTEAFVTYADYDDLHRSAAMLTRLSSFRTPDSPTSPLFIPMELKYANPKKFGEYVAKQNHFLNHHRNVAIVGVVPEAMDFKAPGEIDLYSSLKNLPGVYRCDPTRRTPDLGKWNISCHETNHPDICRWIDDHLVALWQTIPIDLPPMTTFPQPERLSKGRSARGSSLSVSSGLTDASPVSDYMKTLESSFEPHTVATKTIRNPWIQSVPIEDVAYSFDAAAFPPMHTDKTTTTTTTAAETHTLLSSHAAGTTAISAITEDFVSSKITGIELKRATDSAEFDQRLSALESKIASISETVQKMSTQITDEVMKRLSAPDGPLATQTIVLSTHTEQMNRMFSMLSSLTGNQQQLVTASITPPPLRNARERALTQTADNEDCPSPDRKLSRVGAHPNDENGMQTE